MNDFESFKAQKLREGFDEVLIRTWEPHVENPSHSHPFDTDAVLVKGDYWLTIGNQIRHLQVGDAFQVARNVGHSEKYGPQGAIFWAARKN